MRVLTLVEWQAEGIARFGPDVNRWVFVCPSCGQAQTRQDWLAYETHPAEADRRLAFDCIGIRAEEVCPGAGAVYFAEATRGAGCLYTAAGVFDISPVRIKFGAHERSMFEFKEA